MLRTTVLFLLVFFTNSLMLSQPDHLGITKLVNPISPEYLKNNLKKKTPRIILTDDLKKDLKLKIEEVPEVGNYYSAIQLNAENIVKEPLLERIKIGRRLLRVSREMLYRMGILSMVYCVDGHRDILNRINDELLAVCEFSDWNPSHYLDVAEMSLAVALAVDWVGKDLPKSTVEICKQSLIEKGIKPSYNEKGNVGWINGSNNDSGSGINKANNCSMGRLS